MTVLDTRCLPQFLGQPKKCVIFLLFGLKALKNPLYSFVIAINSSSKVN